jgi:DNA-binding transcriptional ArsR family regulator
VADPGRCRILLALGDGRALPATRLAAEAGVSPATASSHLSKLTQAGLLAVEPQGRYRYYRLAGPAVGRLLESLHELAPATVVRSLRQGTRARALREARTCYDHLAGRLGVDLMAALIERGQLTGGDGTCHPERAGSDRPVGPGHDVDYALTDTGLHLLAELGVQPPGGPWVVRYCIDGTEQRHHLAGALGRALRNRLRELGWIEPAEATRAVMVTPGGREGLRTTFGVNLRQDEIGDVVAISR